MGNIKNIYFDWNKAGSCQVRQYDHLSNRVIFGNAPKFENYYLLVAMKESESDEQAKEMSPIKLTSPVWLIPNSYTQMVQQIKFQICNQDADGTFEQHSAEYTINVVKSHEHEGEDIDVDPSPMYDAYKEYVDDRIEELIDEAGGISVDTREYVDEKIQTMIAAAGDVAIDTTLSVSGAAADAKATGDAISETNERLGNAEVGVSALQEGARVLYGASEEVNVSISAIPVLTSGAVYVLEVIPALDREAVAVSVGTPDGQGREQSLGTFAFVTGVPIYITFTANGDWSRVRFPSVARNVSVNVYNFSVSDYFDSKISETNNKVETISDNVADIATIDTEIQDPTETVYNRDTLSVLTGYVATKKGNYKAKGDWNTVYVYTEESCLAVLNPSTTMTVSYGGYSSQEPAVGATVDKAIGVRNEDFPNTFEKALLVPANSYVYVNIPNTVTQHTITLYKGEFVKTYALNPQFSLTQAMREDVEGIIESKGSQQYGLSSDALLYRSLIPSYYGEVQAETPATFDEAYPYIENKINSIPSGKSFIFITDTHWAGNQKHSTQLINYIRKRTGIKKVVFGGDILGNEVTPQLFVKSGGAYLLESRQAFGSDYIPAVGDHDSNSNVRTGYTVEEQFLSYTEMERMFMGDLKNVAHAYQPTEKLAQYATGNNYNECLAFFKTVYYVDDNENEIRYIVLNNGNNGADYGAMHDVFGSSGSDVLRLQIDWLAETLMSTPEGYDIVVAAHKVNQGSSSGNTVLFLLNGFARAAASCKPAPSSVGSVIESWWPHTKSYNFAGRPNVGKIISINGHVHKDETFWCGYDEENVYHRNEVYDGTTILNQTEYGQIPSISTQCDAAANVSSTGFPMTVGTVSEQCFDIITFTNDGVALTRIGAGEDRRYYTNA